MVHIVIPNVLSQQCGYMVVMTHSQALYAFNPASPIVHPCILSGKVLIIRLRLDTEKVCFTLGYNTSKDLGGLKRR